MKNVKEPNQSRYADIVIQLQQTIKEGLEEELKNLLSDYDYAYIVHDKDVDENGVLKGKHIHLFLDYGINANKRQQAVLNEITTLIAPWCPNKHAVSVSLVGAKLIERKLKYLTHENKEDIEKGKYRYEKTAIVATPKYADRIFAKELSDNALKAIVELLDNGADTIAIINEIGLDNYNKYRWTIVDIGKCLVNRKKMAYKERQLEYAKQKLCNYLLNGGQNMTDRDMLHVLADIMGISETKTIGELINEVDTPF